MVCTQLQCVNWDIAWWRSPPYFTVLTSTNQWHFCVCMHGAKPKHSKRAHALTDFMNNFDEGSEDTGTDGNHSTGQVTRQCNQTSNA